MIETQTQTQANYKCTSCAMVKTVAASQIAPKCCGRTMEATTESGPKPGATQKGSCCSN